MKNENEQNKTKNVRSRQIELNLSDEDYEKVLELCGRYSLTFSQLLENFIADLVGGTYSDVNDEKMLAVEWFERCWFGMFPEETLLKWLFDEWLNVEEFLELIENIEEGYTELENYKIVPELYSQEEIEYLKTDMEQWMDRLQKYKEGFKKVNQEAEWEKEVENVKKWFVEKERTIQK